MKRTEWLQEQRLMQFEEAYDGWTQKRLSQEDAAYYCLIELATRPKIYAIQPWKQG